MPATRRPPAVAQVLERVTATAREHEMFLPGQTVLVSVSGGPDSVCLLESLLRLRRLFKIKLEVFHFDHRLRHDSARDASYVKRLAERHKLNVNLRTAESVPAKGASIEEWARGERRFAAAALLRDLDAQRFATAHTRDDQAETVLYRLLMGAGPAGLGGIRHHLGPYVRPLLDVDRASVEAFCRSLGLRPRRDPTNDDPRYALRNAIRLEGLPALERAVGREVREPIARSAALVVADDAELTRQMYEAWSDVYEDAPEGADLRAVGLLDLPGVVASRLVAQAVFRIGHPCTRSDIRAVLDLAAGRPGRRRDLSYGSTAWRDREYVHLSRSSPNDPRPN